MGKGCSVLILQRGLKSPLSTWRTEETGKSVCLAWSYMSGALHDARLVLCLLNERMNE